MFDGSLEIRTRRGTYRHPYTFEYTPTLLDRMTVDFGERTNVVVVIVSIEPKFTAGNDKPTLRVTCEEQDYHEERKRLGPM
jgi:hypothetical protein